MRCRARTFLHFATAAVTDRAYYYALLPDEGVMAFADDQKAPEALERVLQNWWNEHGKPAVDAQAARPAVASSGEVPDTAAGMAG